MVITCTSTTHALPVPDVERGRDWYASLLGREPDIVPTAGVYEWRLLTGVWLQIIEGAPASEGTGQMLRLGVPDLDQAVRAITSSGGTALEHVEVPGVITIQVLQDPFGNRLSCYQELG